MQQLTITDNITRVDCDSLNKYFKEISREHLLTAEEEVEIVRRIKKGDHRAKDKLVKANLRFVVSIAKQYQNGPVPLSDLINEGNIGLIKAAERFDETRGFKFISYAVWWIRQAILTALDEQSRVIRVPSHKISNMSKIKKIKEGWAKKNGRYPTSAELAEDMNMDEEDINETISTFNSTSSLDAICSMDGDHSLMDLITDKASDEELEQTSYFEQLKNDVSHILARLNEREKEIVEMVFGIDCPSPLSLDEISKHLGISRERIRQIKEKALKKLSFHAIRKKIKKLTAA
ncbi:sigma-70 family RNA polymerase sigma factor [Ekhidna sp.]